MFMSIDVFRPASVANAGIMAAMPTDHSQELAALKDALEAARAYL
jgi:hypothetical protein